MAYTVLARKYRSWTFKELVGQEAVATTLENAITSGRIHHGYLFSGTRGVGKTSAARVLARSLNCLKTDGPTIEPCLKCESCLAVAEGQDVDVIEIDAASNTGVDNIRDLRNNANYRPARARFKIYIIDEVHMLSTGAFNALLKTLEEPPGHVKFILATTDPQKVPATVQSRCLRFDFRSISVDKIAGHFASILEQEEVEADEAVLRRVARLAKGSMRDGLSLLDQLLAMGRDKLTTEMLDDLLPTPHDELLTRLVGQLADHDAAGALTSLDQCLSGGYSLERFAESLGEQVRTLMLLHVCGADTSLVELPASAQGAMVELSPRFEAEAYVYMIAALEELRREVRFSAMGRALAEACLVRLAGAVRYRSVQTLLDALGDESSAPPGGPAKKVEPTPAPAAKPAPARKLEPPARAERSVPAERVTSPATATKGASTAAPGSRSPARSTKPRGTSGGPRRAAALPPPTASGEDLKAAAADPAVREALELFDGSLVNVEKQTDGGRPRPPKE